MAIKDNIDYFLMKYGMHHSFIDLNKCCNDFIEEMELGLKGEKSSIKMLPTFITSEGEIPSNESIIVIDAGGTNLRIAVLYFNNRREHMFENFLLYPMPGSNIPITKEQFFDSVANYLLPVINMSDKIAFCFSYPIEILPNKDGRLINFTKEIRISGMENEIICEGIKKALKAKGCNHEKDFIIMNDTVSTMLTGIANAKREYDSYIGFILGTGTNTCYIESNNNITKLPDLPCGSMAINMESGGFNKLPLSEFDKTLEATTANPGQQILEKMVSGAYLGSLIYYIIKQGIEDDLFSENFSKLFSELKVSELTMRDINYFCLAPHGNGILSKCCTNNDNDRINLYYIIDGSLERAAKIIIVNLASIMLKTKKGLNPNRPVCIAADGSFFNNSKILRNKINYYVKSFLNDEKKIYCEIVHIENATSVGTAIAGLLN